MLLGYRKEMSNHLFFCRKKGEVMNSVDPIRDVNMIHDIAEYLAEKSDRNALLFLYGIYTGLRISDIRLKRVRDVRGKDRFKVIEKKTGKERNFRVNATLKRALDKYVKDKKDYEYLFASRQGKNRPISRQQAYNILKDAGDKFGLDLIGTHTMRKTFGYHLYKQTGDINLVQTILNHNTPEYTKLYIGLTQDTIDDAIMSLKY